MELFSQILGSINEVRIQAALTLGPRFFIQRIQIPRIRDSGRFMAPYLKYLDNAASY
jgi:hypothetical protein